jgi:hypothetical protein
MLKFRHRQYRSSYEARYFYRLRQEAMVGVVPRVLPFRVPEPRPLEIYRDEPSAPQPSAHPDRSEP